MTGKAKEYMGIVLGILSGILGMCVCAASFWKLGRTLEGAPELLQGRGWDGIWEGDREGGSGKLDVCCDILEDYLVSGKGRFSRDLLRCGLEEEEIDTALQLLEEAEEDALSGDERRLYGKLLYYGGLRKRGKDLPDYESLLSEFGGVLRQIMEDCYVFRLEEKEDFESYLEWLEGIPDILGQMAERLGEQQNLKDFYSRESISRGIGLCGMMRGEEGILGERFEERLAGCTFLTDGEKEALLAEEIELMRERVAPSLQRLENLLGQMEGAEYRRGLWAYPQGAAFYDYLLERNTGSGMDAGEMYRYLDEARIEMWRDGTGQGEEDTGEDGDGDGNGDGFGDVNGDGNRNANGKWNENWNKNGDEGRAVQVRELWEADGLDGPAKAERILAELHWYAQEVFPGMGDADWCLEVLPESFYGKLSKALYVNRDDKDYIYVSNLLGEEDWMSVYQILAHEGFPGHVYSYRVERTFIRRKVERALTFPGCSEGWAVWAEFAAADWLAEGRDEYLGMISENLYDEIVLCQMDIGIHSLGWEMADLSDFAVDVYGEKGGRLAALLWNTLADNPGVYEAYVVGYLKLAEWEEMCREKGMERREFVRMFQQWGQVPFVLAEEWMDVMDWEEDAG